MERLNRLNLRFWRVGVIGLDLGFFLFLWAYLLPIGKKGESVDGRGCSDRSIHIGGWDLIVGSKKHFLLSFLYSGGFTWGNRSMNDTFLSFVLTSFPFVVRVDRDGRGAIGWNGWVWSALGMGVCSVSRLDHGFPFFLFPLLSLFMVGISNLSPSIISISFDLFTIV